MHTSALPDSITRLQYEHSESVALSVGRLLCYLRRSIIMRTLSWMKKTLKLFGEGHMGAPSAGQQGKPNTLPQNTPEPVEKTIYNPELPPKAPEVKREFMFHPSLTAKTEPMYKPKFKLMAKMTSEAEPMAKPTPVLAPCSMLIKAPCRTRAPLHGTA